VFLKEIAIIGEISIILVARSYIKYDYRMIVDEDEDDR
jgi:hypothetical protein